MKIYVTPTNIIFLVTIGFLVKTIKHDYNTDILMITFCLFISLVVFLFKYIENENKIGIT